MNFEDKTKFWGIFKKIFPRRAAATDFLDRRRASAADRS